MRPMKMTPKFSPQFNEHVAKFAAEGKNQGWDTCEGSAGGCESATSAFLDTTSKDFPSMKTAHHDLVGPKFDISQRASIWQPDPDIPSESKYNNPNNFQHVVPVVGDYVFDFTLRQFDPSAAYPHIEHKDSYSKKFNINFPSDEHDE